mmetsp:Transcript_21271/g.66803  ORF Transcript_21271/g.66803 Transcript_21271/m.66803 type:complete len:86 (-) Transcript_21271:483-740(-)
MTGDTVYTSEPLLTKGLSTSARLPRFEGVHCRARFSESVRISSCISPKCLFKSIVLLEWLRTSRLIQKIASGFCGAARFGLLSVG